MYDSNEDLPFVCRLNLPEAAQNVYRTAFNRAWRRATDKLTRFRDAQQHAWEEVRARFARNRVSGRWEEQPRQLAATPAPRSKSSKDASESRELRAEP